MQRMGPYILYFVGYEVDIFLILALVVPLTFFVVFSTRASVRSLTIVFLPPPPPDISRINFTLFYSFNGLCRIIHT